MKSINNIRTSITTLGLLSVLSGLFITGCASSASTPAPTSSDTEAAVIEPTNKSDSGSLKADSKPSPSTPKSTEATKEDTRILTAAEAGEDAYAVEDNTQYMTAAEAGEDAYAIEDNTQYMTAAEAGEDEFYIENITRTSEADQYAATAPTKAELTTHNGVVLDEVIQGMIVGMPYEVARILIVRDGWVPMDGLTPASRNGMDYQEIEDCSGSGLGPCNMIFVDAEMNKLGVGVITSGAEPTVRHWNLNLN